MNTTQMLYFITAAKCLNFTEAANQLYITQPTLSRSISSLESELNVQLFIRDNRKTRLTPAGNTLFQRLSVLYSEYCQIVEEVRDSNRGFEGVFRVGILDGHLVGSFMPQITKQIICKYPNLRIELTRGSFGVPVNKLYEQKLDVAVTLYFDVRDKDHLKSRKIADTMDCFAVLKSNPKAKLERASFANFQDETFILISPHDSSTAAQNVIDGCKSEGFYPKYVYAPNLETVMLMVESGVGVAVINDKNVLIANPDVQLIPFKSFSDSYLVAVWHDENEGLVLNAFLEEITSIV